MGVSQFHFGDLSGLTRSQQSSQIHPPDSTSGSVLTWGFASSWFTGFPHGSPAVCPHTLSVQMHFVIVDFLKAPITPFLEVSNVIAENQF